MACLNLLYVKGNECPSAPTMHSLLRQGRPSLQLLANGTLEAHNTPWLKLT